MDIFIVLLLLFFFFLIITQLFQFVKLNIDNLHILRIDDVLLKYHSSVEIILLGKLGFHFILGHLL